MKKANQKEILMELINTSRNKQAQDLQELKNQYRITVNSFSTLSILKASLQEVVTMPNLTSNIIQGTLKLGTQYLSNTLSNSNSTLANGWMGKIVRFLLKKTNLV